MEQVPDVPDTLIKSFVAHYLRRPKVDAYSAEMSLTRYLAETAPRFDYSRCRLIGVFHLLTDFLQVVDNLESIGFRPEQVTVFGKCYSAQPEVVEELQQRGYLVHVPPTYPFTAVLKETVHDLLLQCREEGQQLFGFDDGGQLSLVLSDLAMEHDISPVRGVVENTQGGIIQIKKSGVALRVGVINVAESVIKKTMDIPQVGRSLLRSTTALLARCGQTLLGLKTFIAGYGAVGEGLTNALIREGTLAVVYDPNPVRALQACANDCDVTADPVEAARGCRLFIGVTGQTSIGPSILSACPDRSFFVNGASGRSEIDVQWLENSSISRRHLEGVGTEYTMKDGRVLTVLADGFPVNFFHPETGVTNHEIDYLLGLHIRCIAHLASLDAPLGSGLHTVPEPLVEETTRALIGMSSRIRPAQAGRVMTSLEITGKTIRRWDALAERIRADVESRHVFEQLLIWSGRVIHSPRSHRLLAESNMDTASRRAGLFATACLRARMPLTADLCDRIQEILTGERIVETGENSLAGERRRRLENALEIFDQSRQTDGGAALLSLLSFFLSGPVYPARNNQSLFLAFQIAAGSVGCPLAMPTRELIECFTRPADPGLCELASLEGIVRRAMEEAVEAINVALAAGRSEFRAGAVGREHQAIRASLARERHIEKEFGVDDKNLVRKLCRGRPKPRLAPCRSTHACSSTIRGRRSC
jgi:S-adenosylhomocysteine hydrolase